MTKTPVVTIITNYKQKSLEVITEVGSSVSCPVVSRQ